MSRAARAPPPFGILQSRIATWGWAFRASATASSASWALAHELEGLLPGDHAGVARVLVERERLLPTRMLAYASMPGRVRPSGRSEKTPLSRRTPEAGEREFREQGAR